MILFPNIDEGIDELEIDFDDSIVAGPSYDIFILVALLLVIVVTGFIYRRKKSKDKVSDDGLDKL